MRISDEDAAGDVEEKSGVDNTGNLDDFQMFCFRMLHKVRKVDVKDEIAIFGEKKRAVVLYAPLALIAQFFDLVSGRRGSEKEHFNG